MDKRQVLKSVIQKGKAHLLPKKCTGEFVEKAPDEAIDKTYKCLHPAKSYSRNGKRWLKRSLCMLSLRTQNL